jgi:hypothetical protein
MMKPYPEVERQARIARIEKIRDSLYWIVLAIFFAVIVAELAPRAVFWAKNPLPHPDCINDPAC